QFGPRARPERTARSAPIDFCSYFVLYSGMLRHASNRPIAVPLPLGGSAARPETAVDESAHYLGHRKRLRARFLEAGAQALADYELLELVLFRAIPQRDLKPLAKSLLARFGSFAEVISAPKERLAEVKGLSAAAVVELKIVQAAAQRLVRGEI